MSRTAARLVQKNFSMDAYCIFFLILTLSNIRDVIISKSHRTIILQYKSNIMGFFLKKQMKEKLQSGFNNNDWISSVSICASASTCCFFCLVTLRRNQNTSTHQIKNLLAHPQFHKLGLFPRQSQHPPVSLYDRETATTSSRLMSLPYCKTADIVASPIKHIVAFIVVDFNFLIFRRCHNLFSELWLNCSNKWIKQIWVVFKTYLWSWL